MALRLQTDHNGVPIYLSAGRVVNRAECANHSMYRSPFAGFSRNGRLLAELTRLAALSAPRGVYAAAHNRAENSV